MEECIPRYQLQKKCNLLWLTLNIKKLIRKCNALFRKAKRTNKNSDFIHYKAIEPYLNKLAHVDLKHFWKYVKILNKNKETVPTLQQGVYIASNDKEKVEMFNKFSASCWNTSELLLSKEVYSIQSSFCDLTVTPDEVFHLINALDTNKASGSDNISAFILKATAESIAEPLAKLFTLSLSKGTFPKLWKTAGIVPIPKSTNKSTSDPTEYRSISLLSIVRKFLERIVHSIL